MRATCVELTAQLRRSATRATCDRCAPRHGPVLWPIDREIDRAGVEQHGYPAHPAYRDYHRLTAHHHRVWRNDGAPYEPAPRAGAGRALTPDEFVARVRPRVAGGGLCVCALDTELLGHWWYEGVAWLDAVLEEAARQGLR